MTAGVYGVVTGPHPDGGRYYLRAVDGQRSRYRYVDTIADARDVLAAIAAVGMEANGTEAIALKCDAHLCQRRGCRVWLGDDHYSDERCDRHGGAGLVLCERHCAEVDALSDDDYAAMVERGDLNGWRGFVSRY